jgi:hypothetical protein
MHPQPLPSFGPSHNITIDSASGKGSWRTSTKSATEKVAVLAPTPSAVMSTTVATNVADSFDRPGERAFGPIRLFERADELRLVLGAIRRWIQPEE